MDQIARMFGVTRNNKLGFTLIELLIVIAIIGIIAGIAIPMFLGQRTKAMISEGRTNLQTLFVLQEQYYAENAIYAPQPTRLWVQYGRSGADIVTFLPGFRPGNVADLNFHYWIVTPAGGQTFQLLAIGKPGGSMDGKKFQLNENNEYGIYIP